LGDGHLAAVSDHADWPSIEAALDELLSLPAADQAAALERIATMRPVLRNVLESLLDHAGGSDALLDHPAIEVIPPAAPVTGRLPNGVRIGVYSIVELIGRGGMGEVYRAERADGQFSQTVALKLMRVESSVSIDRFNAERRILAQLDHPGIARLFDGGITADGRPYMVMEYVEGENLAAWCDAHKATLQQRLSLFLQVCEAVAYAHAHLVVHRDLKPTNICVTADGRVKLLDFGIAKLLQSGDAVGDVTRTAHLSPAYAAPEQLTGGAITTATDVYGLGVTLYQLLCETLPWQIEDLPLAIAVRRLLEGKPIPPSTATRVGASVTPRELRGDLDAIVAKSLRKEPQARYPDARALADDIRRHIHHEPIRARDGARVYVLRRFLRRNWLPLSAASLVFVVLVAGIAGTAWQAGVARRQAQRAEIEATTATAVKDFLLDIFKQSSMQNPGGVEARNVTAEKLLNIGAERIKLQLHEQPAVRGELLDTLSSLYNDLGDTDRAVALAHERLNSLDRSQGAEASLASAAARTHLARALIDNGKSNDAKVQLNAAQKILDAMGDPGTLTRAEVDFQQARVAYDGTAEEKPAGLQKLREALEIVQRRDPQNSLTGNVLEYFGYFAQLDEDYSGAEAWKKRFLAFERAQGIERNAFAIGTAYLDLGDVQALMRKFSDAESNLRAAVALLTKYAGPEHPSTAAAKMRLGETFYRMGREPEAEELLGEALRAQQKTAQGLEDSTETGKTLGALELARGRLAQAESILRKNLAQLGSGQHKELRYGVSASVLTSVLTAEGKFDEAERQYAVSSDVFRRYIGEKSVAYTGSLLRGAALKLGEGQLDQAAQIYEQVMRDWPPPSGQFPDPYTRSTLGLARADLQRGRTEAARARCEELLGRITASPERRYLPDQEAQTVRLLGAALTRSGQATAAEPHLRRAIELRELLDAPESFWLAEARISLAVALIAQQRLAEARQLLELAAAAQARQPALSNEYREPLRAALKLTARATIEQRPVSFRKRDSPTPALALVK
jgi:serine/threonine protein kinase/TolA-binding protein